MKQDRLEIMRFMIPTSKIIGDNSATHWKSHMGKLKWLSNKTRNIIEGFEEAPGNFQPPTADETKDFIDGKPVKVIFEIWRYGNRAFDLYNYSKTSKAIIDSLTNLGYWEDDNWNYMRPVVVNGGGLSVWNEHIIAENSTGLPKDNSELKEWWKENNDDMKSTFMRLIISKDRNL